MSRAWISDRPHYRYYLGMANGLQPPGQRMRDSISMKQMSLGAGFERKSRRTRKREFPDEMNCVPA